MEIVKIPIDELTMYKKNAKLHPREQIEQIKQSIKMYGFNDPVGIWGKNNTIVEGHGRYMAAQELGIEEIPCIRLDHLTDKQRREYMLVHNQTTMNSGWDYDKLMQELDGMDFEGFDFGFEDFEDLQNDEPEESQNIYTDEINIPQYTPSDEDVKLNDCFDKEKADSLIEEINNSNVSREEKEFLKLAAMRHVGFIYKKIADYYANASKEMQKLMEKSALVLIDYGDAIKNGYAELRSKIKGALDDE